MNQWQYQALFSPLVKLVKNEERLELTFLDSLKFNMKDKELVFFLGYKQWQHVLLEHNTLWTFRYSCFSLHFQLSYYFESLLLHFSFIHGESDHVSYMIDKSSCPIYLLYTALGHLCVVLTVQGFFHYLIYSLIQSRLYMLSIYLCLPSFSQFRVTLVIRWRISCLPYHSMVLFQHFLMTKT